MPQISIILQFAFATLLPVAMGWLLTVAFDRGPLKDMSYWPRQLLCGFVFGAIAVFGTEFGIDTQDATMNVRDAAPLVAGLYLGSPAGIMAGIIGGVERWFSVLWGRGVYTRVACSVATIAVGFYAALLNRYVFDDRKPSWPLAMAVGMVAEVLHLLLVILTHLDDSAHAVAVARACSLPMISCTGLSVALAGLLIAWASGYKPFQRASTKDISQTIQAGMLAVVVVGFFASVGFTYLLQENVAYTNSMNTLQQSISDVHDDILDASDENLIALTRRAADIVGRVADTDEEQLQAIVEALDVSEVHAIDNNGIIVVSSDPMYVGFDMASGAQSAEFLKLLNRGSSSYIVQAYQPMTIDSTMWRKFAAVRVPDGMVQVSYDATHFIDDLGSKVKSAVNNRHVGHNGMVMVLTERGQVVATRDGVIVTTSDAQAITNSAGQSEEGSIFTVELHGVNYYSIYEGVEGFRIIALLPVSEANEARDISVLTTTFMEVLIFAALFAAIYVLIRHVVVSSIWQVNGTLDKITAGDLEAEVDVRNSTEFASLSDDINRTVAALRKAIAAESARIERDLATAKAIQESALPRSFPPFPDLRAFDIYASMNAAREVGGDFYDFFLIDDHTLGFLIADVSGKGIPASLFMMAAKSELGNYITSGMDLAEAVHSANLNLCRQNNANMFVTVWAATLDYHTGKLTYVNAGHNPPLLRHNGSWTWLTEKGGLFLGTFERAKYRSKTLQLEEGDEIFLYTDGVNEAFSADDEQFGDDRLEQFLAANADRHPHELIDRMRAELRRWAEGAEQSDDITMLCLEYGVPPEVTGTFRVQATGAGMEELKGKLHYELSHLQCPESVQAQIDLTVEELFTNICTYGYQGDGSNDFIELAFIYNSDPDSIVISISDQGVPFDPLGYERPADDSGDEVTGSGIKLAFRNVDDISYVRDGDTNTIAFRKIW